MVDLYAIYQNPGWFVFLLLVLVLWEIVWKGLGLWYAGKNQQKAWFIVILIFNTCGLLPIIYLLWFKPRVKKENNNHSRRIVKKK